MKTYRKQFISDFVRRFGKHFTMGVLAAVALGAPRLAIGNELFIIDLAIGNGSVTGTITTDGSLGMIGRSDFVGFDLTINAPFGSATATNPSDFFAFSGDDLSETASALVFDFSGAAGAGFTILSDDASQAWSVGGSSYLQAICGACDPGAAPGVEDDSRIFPAYYSELTGDEAIGTTAPELGALLLSSTGLIGLALLRTRLSVR